MRIPAGGRGLPLALLKRSFDASPRDSVFVLVLAPACVGSDLLFAFAVQQLVESVSFGAGAAIVIGVTVGAFSLVLQFILTNIMEAIRFRLITEVSMSVESDVLVAVASHPTVERHADPAFAEDLLAVRRGPLAVAGFPWAMYALLCTAATLVASTSLLVIANGWLWLLAAGALMPIVAGAFAQPAIRRAQQASLEHARREEVLHSAIVAPESSKDLLLSGAFDAVEREARRSWSLASGVLLRGQFGSSAIQATGWVAFGAVIVLTLIIVTEGPGGGLSAGGAALLVLLASRLRFQLAEVLAGVSGLNEGAHLGAKYRSLIATHPAAAATTSTGGEPAAVSEGLTFNDVSLTYPGSSRTSLRNITISIPPATTVGVVGLNGAGKSTFINLALGIVSPSQGTVLLDSNDVSQLSAFRAAAFQDFIAPPLAIREVVGIGDVKRIGDDDAIWSSIDRAGARSVVESSVSGGLESQVGARVDGEELSGGEWQKLAIARGFMPEAPLLVAFDEPTSALDAESEHALFSAYALEVQRVQARTGAICFIASHRFSTVAMADLIIVLADGAIVEQGTHTELLSRRGRYWRMFDLQRNGYK